MLRSSGAAGRLAPDLRAALRRERSLLGRLVRALLDTHFPPSLHLELGEAVGLDLEPAETGAVTGIDTAARWGRDRRMREPMLTAYEFQCAFCGHGGMLDPTSVGPQRFVGRSEAGRHQVLALLGRSVLCPRTGDPPVARQHREWHTRQVFRGVPRVAVRVGAGWGGWPTGRLCRADRNPG